MAERCILSEVSFVFFAAADAGGVPGALWPAAACVLGRHSSAGTGADGSAASAAGGTDHSCAFCSPSSRGAACGGLPCCQPHSSSGTSSTASRSASGAATARPARCSPAAAAAAAFEQCASAAAAAACSQRGA